MIMRHHLKCYGCEELFTVRLGVEPTRGTRFYVPCPLCGYPNKGSMAGTELEDHRVDLDCEFANGPDPEIPGVPVITVNPFVPSRYDADPLASKTVSTGMFPTMTVLQLLGFDGYEAFQAERHKALDAGRSAWPGVRKLFRFYLQGNDQMFTKIAKEKFGLDWDPATAHERTSVAYQALGLVTKTITGTTGTSAEGVIRRFAMKHTAAMKRDASHLVAFRSRGQLAEATERDLFTEIDRFVDQHESWELGLLLRFVGPEAKAELQDMVLYRDEFATVRDLYQQGFELACKCLWPLVAAQNTLMRGDPHDFGDAHPPIASVPEKQRPTSLKKFDRLANAHKIAYVTMVPGWEPFGELLNSRRRNAIGHATAHHDLKSGRVTSDKDPDGMTYLDFLGETLGIFEALSTLAQVFRAVRVASSPDFNVPYDRKPMPSPVAGNG
jgi:hypothetical protein